MRVEIFENAGTKGSTMPEQRCFNSNFLPFAQYLARKLNTTFEGLMTTTTLLGVDNHFFSEAFPKFMIRIVMLIV